MSKFKDYLMKVRMMNEDAASEQDLIATDKDGKPTTDVKNTDGFKIIIGKPSEGHNFVLGKNSTVQDVYNDLVKIHPWIKMAKRPTESLIYVGSKDNYANKLKEWLGGEKYSLIKLNETQGPFSPNHIEFDLVPVSKDMTPKLNPKNKQRYTLAEMQQLIESEKKAIADGKPPASPTYICLTYVRDAKPTT